MKGDIEVLRKALSYDKETGAISWRISTNRRIKVGSIAGGIGGGGYHYVKFNGKKYLSHRIAWAITHGSWPAGEIDHRNGKRDDNRISNLRDVSASVNQQNRQRAHSNNKSGSSVPGVCFDKQHGKFRVTAKRDGKNLYIGLFKTVPEAESASIAYRRENYKGNTL